MGTRSSRTAATDTKAPDFSLPRTDGTTWRLSEAIGKGPVVLVFLRGFS